MALQRWQVLLLLYSSERPNTPAFAAEAMARQAGHPHPVFVLVNLGRCFAAHQSLRANQVRGATASGSFALRLAEDEFRGKGMRLIEAAFSSFSVEPGFASVSPWNGWICSRAMPNGVIWQANYNSAGQEVQHA